MLNAKYMSVVVRVENISKKYQLGKIGTQSLKGDVQRWWARTRGKEDPFGTIGKESNGRNGEFWALKDVSFDLRQGEAIGIIGKNGAGKSTLLKILSRITLPTSGRMRVKGRIASLLEVGTGFNPDLTGRENIFLNGAILGMTKREVQRKFDEIVDFSGVDKFIDTPVKRYSSGMYVRLAFAVAAHLESEILILDEVLAVGDAEFQKKCLGKMDDVAHKQGRTVIFVSHGMQSVRQLCNRGLFLEHGKLAGYDTIEKVIDMYTRQDGGKGVYAKEWHPADAPANKQARLLKVQISDAAGNPTERLATDEAFGVEIYFEILRDGAYAGLTAIFFDGSGNCVFSSISNRERNFYGKPMPAGVYRSRCEIPPNLFNDGVFDIAINLFNKNFTDARLAENVLRIEILDGLAVRGDYTAGYGGVVRPMLSWNTTKLENKLYVLS